MKTPREILLARHETAEPKLDALREHVLAELRKPRRENSSWRDRCAGSLRSLFHVPRFAWTGLAAAWFVIIALHFATRDSAPGQAVALAQSRPSAETLQAVREQKRLLAELTDRVEKPEGHTPRVVPRRRSERRLEFNLA